MKAIDVASRPLSEVDHRAQLRRAVIASTVGTTIEWYDFLLYSQAAALVFGKLFFPRSDPLVGVMEAFAVFFVGYVTRPIGAAIFGHFGDRIGRKKTLVTTLLITGFATFAVGLVPTYASIGIWGAVLLTILRLIQGIGVGGEWGRLGTIVDGMGTNECASWLHCRFATIRGAGRIAAGKFLGAGLQRDLGRSVPGLGVAYPLPAQHHHGWAGPLHPTPYSRAPIL